MSLWMHKAVVLARGHFSPDSEFIQFHPHLESFSGETATRDIIRVPDRISLHVTPFASADIALSTPKSFTQGDGITALMHSFLTLIC